MVVVSAVVVPRRRHPNVMGPIRNHSPDHLSEARKENGLITFPALSLFNQHFNQQNFEAMFVESNTVAQSSKPFSFFCHDQVKVV